MDVIQQYAKCLLFLLMIAYGFAGVIYASLSIWRAVADWWWNAKEPFDVFED